MTSRWKENAALPVLKVLSTLSLVCIGCAGPRLQGVGPYEFTVRFERNEGLGKECPTVPELAPEQRNCTTLIFFKRSDCVKADRGQQVQLKALPARSPKFSVYFDPARKFPFEPDQEGKVTVEISRDAPYKTYEFYIVSDDCPVPDPQIIVTK